MSFQPYSVLHDSIYIFISICKLSGKFRKSYTLFYVQGVSEKNVPYSQEGQPATVWKNFEILNTAEVFNLFRFR